MDQPVSSWADVLRKSGREWRRQRRVLECRLALNVSQVMDGNQREVEGWGGWNEERGGSAPW